MAARGARGGSAAHGVVLARWRRQVGDDGASAGPSPRPLLAQARLGHSLTRTPITQVIVDNREFRSTLPGLLHGARFCIKPRTLSIGDYIITPDMAVERKSIPDLIQSFTSGRLCALALSFSLLP